MIRAFAIIFACLAAGELLVRLTGLKLPASIPGLLLLFVLLQLGWVKAEWFKQITDFLMQNLMLLLIPPCVALMDHLDLIARDFWSITLATIASSILVLLASAKTHEWMRKRR
ncbi:MAG: CidA/LrgA family protein [Eikenella sp.]|nr:CidA/LrgA family protein [Eikenella sp.]